MSIIKVLRFIVLLFLALCQVGLLLLTNLFVIICNPKTIVDLYHIVKKKPLSRDGKPPPAQWNDPSLGEHGFLQLKGIKLHYVACGDEDKPLMLFIHGFVGCWYNWRHQIREFSKNYRVVAIDRRGYSLSDCPVEKSNYTLLKNATDIGEVIEALGYNDCILVGCDLGASIAMIAAAHFPDKISKVIVFNIAAASSYMKYSCEELSDVRFLWVHLYAAIPYSPEFMMVFNDFKSFKYIYSPENGVRKESLTQEDLEVYKYALSQKGSIYAVLNSYRNLILVPYRKLVEPQEKVDWNILFINGSKNVWVKKVMIDDTKKYFDNGVFKTVEGAAQFVYEDQPSVVNELINEFLNQGGNKE